MSDEKLTTRDQIDVLVKEGDSMDHKELIEKLEDLFGQNSHKVYDSFHATLVKDTNLGWALLFEGEREESKDETASREAMEAGERKRVKEAELKLYLKLNKKYGKKNK